MLESILREAGRELRLRELLPGLFSLALGHVNAFLIRQDHQLTVIDTGNPGAEETILGAAESVGLTATDIQHVLVTHCHSDHSGSLAAIRSSTGGATYMHRVDAELVRKGETMRPVVPAPTVVGRLFYRSYIKNAPPSRFRIPAVEVDNLLDGGETIDAAGGIEVIHAPGHCAGQVVFLWHQHGGVLFAADIAANAVRLDLSPVYENLDEGIRTLRRLAGLEFEHACFGHGRPIIGGAATRFRRRFPPRESEALGSEGSHRKTP